MQKDLKNIKEDLQTMKDIQASDGLLLKELLAWYLGVQRGVSELKQRRV